MTGTIITSSMNHPEFQAVILCGTGHHLYPLTEPNHIPKALLPIAGRPMIGYVLAWLERDGIYDVIVVAHKVIGSKLSNYLHKVHVGAIQVELVLQEVSQDEEFGTLDALLLIKDRLKSDFILLSCDIISDISMAPLIETFRLERPSILTLLTQYPRQNIDTESHSTTDGSKSKSSTIPSISLPQSDEIVITDSKETILLGLEHRSSIDSEEEFQLPLNLIYQHPLLKIRTDLYDPHVYIISHYMLRVISLLRDKQLQYKKQDDDIYTSFREEFIPWWVKTQYHSQSYKLYEQLIKNSIQSHSSHISIKNNDNDIYDQGYDSYNHNNMNRLPNPGEYGYCRIHILNLSCGQICARANTLSTWSELNKFIAKTCMYPGSIRLASTAEISVKTQIGSDSMIGDHTRIGDRCSIKKSIVGSQCVLGNNVKLSGCVIMDYVTIEDNVKLDSVIVCQKAIIREKASLKDCEVGVGYIVERELVTKGETLVDDYRYHGASGTSMVSGSQSSHASMSRHYGQSGSSLTEEDIDSIPDLHIGHP